MYIPNWVFWVILVVLFAPGLISLCLTICYMGISVALVVIASPFVLVAALIKGFVDFVKLVLESRAADKRYEASAPERQKSLDVIHTLGNYSYGSYVDKHYGSNSQWASK